MDPRPATANTRPASAAHTYTQAPTPASLTTTAVEGQGGFVHTVRPTSAWEPHQAWQQQPPQPPPPHFQDVEMLPNWQAGQQTLPPPHPTPQLQVESPRPQIPGSWMPAPAETVNPPFNEEAAWKAQVDDLTKVVNEQTELIEKLYQELKARKAENPKARPSMPPEVTEEDTDGGNDELDGTHLVLKVRSQLPPTFNGDADKYEEWRYRVKNHLYILKQGDAYTRSLLSFTEGPKMMTFVGRLTAKYHKNNRWTCSIAELWRALDETFDDGLKADVARMELLQFQQGKRTLQDYLSEFEILAIKGGMDLDNALVLQLVEKGLSKPLRERMAGIAKIPTSWVSLRKTLIALDMRMRSLGVAETPSKSKDEPKATARIGAQEPRCWSCGGLRRLAPFPSCTTRSWHTKESRPTAGPSTPNATTKPQASNTGPTCYTCGGTQTSPANNCTRTWHRQQMRAQIVEDEIDEDVEALRAKIAEFQKQQAILQGRINKKVAKYEQKEIPQQDFQASQ